MDSLFKLLLLSVVWDGGYTSCPPSPRHLAQGAERRSKLGREQLWLFPDREVTAFVDLVKVDEVGVGLLDPAARGPEVLAAVGAIVTSEPRAASVAQGRPDRWPADDESDSA